jgi:hypothetical protein
MVKQDISLSSFTIQRVEILKRLTLATEQVSARSDGIASLEKSIMVQMADRLLCSLEAQKYRMRHKTHQRIVDDNIRRAQVKAISENFSSEHMASRVGDPRYLLCAGTVITIVKFICLEVGYWTKGAGSSAKCTYQAWELATSLSSDLFLSMIRKRVGKRQS